MIAFRITISFSAVEDFIKRLFRANDEIKVLRPVCRVSKNGIEILTQVALWDDAKIPEVTEKIQLVVKSRLHQMLGMDETIAVKVYVVKIAARESLKSKPGEEKNTEVEAPYQYRD